MRCNTSQLRHSDLLLIPRPAPILILDDFFYPVLHSSLGDLVGMVSIDTKWRNSTISHNPKCYQCWQYLQPLSKSSVWNQSVSCKVSSNEAGSSKNRTTTFFSFFYRTRVRSLGMLVANSLTHFSLKGKASKKPRIYYGQADRKRLPVHPCLDYPLMDYSRLDYLWLDYKPLGLHPLGLPMTLGLPPFGLHPK